MKKLIQTLGVACSLCILPFSVNAVLMTVDEIIYETSGATDPSLLSGTVDMSLSGSELSIVLTNTSTDIASPTASHNLLSGLGFVLPDGVYIDWGTATITTGSTAINFTAPADGNVSGEWGYDNNPLDNGPFQNSDITNSTVNTVVSTMQSSTTTKFSDTPIETPAVLSGPEFGLLSGLVNEDVAGGLNAIQDSITILLGLDGLLISPPSELPPGDSQSFDLLAFIESNDIVLSFGSPNLSSVPEPTSLMLFAIGLLGFASLRLGRK
jgi:hypothetical protein